MPIAADLRDEFGGHWDGGRGEVHGLIDRGGRTLKLELLGHGDKRWVCAVFADGACLATVSARSAHEAVRRGLGEALEA